MRKTAITFGVISGAIITVYTFGLFLVFGDFSQLTTQNLGMVEAFGYLRYIILFLTLFFAIRHFRKLNDNRAGFRQLFLAGLYTALVVALLVGLMEFVFMLMNPDFMEQYASLSTRRLEESGASAAEIARNQKAMDSMKWMAHPAAMGVFYFFETAILGTIISALLALLLKTRNTRESRGIA